MGEPDLMITGPIMSRALQNIWDRALAKRMGVTVEAIQRFRGLGWLEAIEGPEISSPSDETHAEP